MNFFSLKKWIKNTISCTFCKKMLTNIIIAVTASTACQLTGTDLKNPIFN